MKVLWFTNTPSNYISAKNGYNGGGWISALENEIKKQNNISLGICFLFNKEESVTKNGTSFYPIKVPRYYKFKTYFRKTYKEEQEQTIIKKFLRVINEFQPDIIHIFGTEQQYGLIAPYIKIPIVIHIQGILTPCFNAYLPPFVSWSSIIRKKINIISFLFFLKNKNAWKRNIQREQYIIKNIHNYIGRTQWVYRVIKTLNPQCKYYLGNEILRETFYTPLPRILPNQLTIVSTISNPLYKGFDLILKTAFLLKNNLNLTFRWIIYGNINPSFIENITKINHKTVNIELKGVASAEEIKKTISKCTLYMHPSYIDNSPNSLCEAQILGCPVVATNVGGIPSLIKDGETGYLVPANDPYQAAYIINTLFHDREKNIQIGLKAQAEANSRHIRTTIINELIKTYKNIISLEE